jgi:hypothetical protein
MTKDSSDRFERIGDGYGDVENLSGAGWSGSQVALRPGPPGHHVLPRALPHRRQVEITAQSGEKLDDSMAQGLIAAARYLSIRREHVDQSHPSARPMLEHIFGLNLPGRDR